jgi:hypothetical protein
LHTVKKHYIERLQMVIHQLHGCDSTWLESVPVHEVFRGQTIWQGTVEVFALSGHPKAKRAYGWHHAAGTDDNDERFVTVLELPPVDSPQAAVKVAAAKEIREARKRK